MDRTVKAPLDCNSMTELRDEIDAIDASLVALLSRRCKYIDRAVALKTREGLPPRTTDRIASMMDRIRLLAEEQEVDPELAETLWTALIEWGIAYEARAMDAEKL